MKRSKIRISIICMCAALILGVCGCSQKAQNEAPGTNEPSGAAAQQEQKEQEALPEEEPPQPVSRPAAQAPAAARPLAFRN